jgi:hypothetical protein
VVFGGTRRDNVKNNEEFDQDSLVCVAVAARRFGLERIKRAIATIEAVDTADARDSAYRRQEDVATLLAVLETQKVFQGFGPKLDAAERWRKAAGLTQDRFLVAFEYARSVSPPLFLDEGRGVNRVFTSLPGWQRRLAEGAWPKAAE